MAPHHTALLAAASLVAYWLFLKVQQYLVTTKFQKDHGCLAPKRIAQSERVIGFGVLMALRRHHKAYDFLDWMKMQFDAYGNTFSLSTFGKTLFWTCDPANIKAILATQFEDFCLGHRLGPFGPLLGTSIFTTDGAAWQHSRALVRPAFTRNQVADLEMFDLHTEKLLSKISESETVDLAPLFFELTLDVALQFLFGGSPNPSSDVVAKRQKFGKAFDYAQNKLGNFGTFGWSSYVWPARRFHRDCKTVHAFANELVAEAQRRAADEKCVDGNEKDQERYVFLNELVKETDDTNRIRDELMSVLLAGRDTTASLLTMSFHVLAQRPDIWKKLKSEVDELGGTKPDYETLRSMKYVRNFLNESLRLNPVVPGNSRRATKLTTLPVGGGPDGKSPIVIQKGQTIFYSVYSMQRSEEHYGADALEFKPERWDELRTGWNYLPFNGGPRICVGQQFALSEASYTLVRILQSFREISSRDPGPFLQLLGLTMTSKHGAKVAFTR